MNPFSIQKQNRYDNFFVNNHIPVSYTHLDVYKRQVTDMHQAAFVLSNPEMEPVIAAPDNLKEANLGILAYYKPGSGLEMLRNSIVCLLYTSRCV